MFEQVKVSILGIVENMSYLQCPHCNDRIDLFGMGGGKSTAEAMNVHFLGELPVDPKVRIGGDSGAPIALHDSVFDELSKKMIARVEEVGLPLGPTVTITD
jgi:ATP-binding protein involved in chromosome partitioning